MLSSNINILLLLKCFITLYLSNNKDRQVSLQTVFVHPKFRKAILKFSVTRGSKESSEKTTCSCSYSYLSYSFLFKASG